MTYEALTLSSFNYLLSFYSAIEQGYFLPLFIVLMARFKTVWDYLINHHTYILSLPESERKNAQHGYFQGLVSVILSHVTGGLIVHTLLQSVHPSSFLSSAPLLISLLVYTLFYFVPINIVIFISQRFRWISVCFGYLFDSCDFIDMIDKSIKVGLNTLPPSTVSPGFSLFYDTNHVVQDTIYTVGNLTYPLVMIAAFLNSNGSKMIVDLANIHTTWTVSNVAPAFVRYSPLHKGYRIFTSLLFLYLLFISVFVPKEIFFVKEKNAIQHIPYITMSDTQYAVNWSGHYNDTAVSTELKSNHHATTDTTKHEPMLCLHKSHYDLFIENLFLSDIVHLSDIHSGTSKPKNLSSIRSDDDSNISDNSAALFDSCLLKDYQVGSIIQSVSQLRSNPKLLTAHQAESIHSNKISHGGDHNAKDSNKDVTQHNNSTDTTIIANDDNTVVSSDEKIQTSDNNHDDIDTLTLTDSPPVPHFHLPFNPPAYHRHFSSHSVDPSRTAGGRIFSFFDQGNMNLQHSIFAGLTSFGFSIQHAKQAFCPLHNIAVSMCPKDVNHTLARTLLCDAAIAITHTLNSKICTKPARMLEVDFLLKNYRNFSPSLGHLAILLSNIQNDKSIKLQQQQQKSHKQQSEYIPMPLLSRLMNASMTTPISDTCGPIIGHPIVSISISFINLIKHNIIINNIIEYILSIYQSIHILLRKLLLSSYTLQHILGLYSLYPISNSVIPPQMLLPITAYDIVSSMNASTHTNTNITATNITTTPGVVSTSNDLSPLRATVPSFPITCLPATVFMTPELLSDITRPSQFAVTPVSALSPSLLPSSHFHTSSSSSDDLSEQNARSLFYFLSRLPHDTVLIVQMGASLLVPISFSLFRAAFILLWCITHFIHDCITPGGFQSPQTTKLIDAIRKENREKGNKTSTATSTATKVSLSVDTKAVASPEKKKRQ